MSDQFSCGRFVASRIRSLVGKDPAALNPNARAMLAQLRQAVAHDPGTVPSVWPITLEGLPEMRQPRLGRTEAAIHLALTLFAVHQQARSASMHTPDQPFGTAIRKLANLTSGDDGAHTSPAYRRFTAMSTTRTLAGLLTHARGLITQLRAHDIPFNYGRFADNLYWFQVPGRAAEVQREWGRDFHRFTIAEGDSE